MITVVKQKSLVENTYADSSDVCSKAEYDKTRDQQLFDRRVYFSFRTGQFPERTWLF
jgi:hypothetical protein